MFLIYYDCLLPLFHGIGICKCNKSNFLINEPIINAKTKDTCKYQMWGSSHVHNVNEYDESTKCALKIHKL